MRLARCAALAAVLWMAAASAQASPANGTLVVAEVVQLSEAAMRRIEPARQILTDVEIQQITYLSDGLQVRGYLAMPRTGEKLPCVIYNRGGNRAFGALNDSSAVRLLGPIAREGYVVVASQYRGTEGGEGQEEFGGSDVGDVLNLIPLLEALPRADASRIGMIGWSRGGMMTYLAVARTQRIAAAVVGSADSDLLEGVRTRPEMASVYRQLIPGYDENPDAALAKRSAALWPEQLNKATPLLILQGGSDWRVDPGQSLVIAQKLHEARHPFRLVMFEGGDHGLTEYRDEVNTLVTSWLHRYVRDRLPWPSLEPHGD